MKQRRRAGWGKPSGASQPDSLGSELAAEPVSESHHSPRECPLLWPSTLDSGLSPLDTLPLMFSPIFSVVMPAYNAERYVGEAIESVLAQTMPSWELLVVDDCSTDRTLEVCRSYRDSRIRVFSSPQNLNAAGARNLALEHAQGEFIALLDSDDWMAPNRLERQWEFFQQHPQVGVCGSYVETFETLQSSANRGTIEYPCGNGTIKATMFFYDPFVTSSVSLRMILTLKSGIPVFKSNYAVAEDYDLWARLIDQTDFANLPEFLTRYRVHGSQLTQTHSAPMRRQVARVFELLFEKIGIEETQARLALHEALIYEKERPMHKLFEIKSWLEMLWSAGLNAGFLPNEEWNKTIGFWWFVACQRAWPRSLKCWRTYRSSPLAKYFFSRRQKLEFLKDCFCGIFGSKA